MDILGGRIDDREMLEMSLGDRVVWPTGPREVVITLGAQHQARNQLRDAIYAAGGHYTTVEVLPFTVVLEGAGSASGLFSGCRGLTAAPDMDTSNVTDMTDMFYLCNSLTAVPDMDTANVTSMGYMFQGCNSLTAVPTMNTSNVTTTRFMFSGCSSLTAAPAMDTSNVTSMAAMFSGCSSLTSVPDMDAGNATDMSNMFQGCTVLHDGSVRLLRNTMPPSSATYNMIGLSGLTRLPFYAYDGTPLT